MGTIWRVVVAGEVTYEKEDSDVTVDSEAEETAVEIEASDAEEVDAAAEMLEVISEYEAEMTELSLLKVDDAEEIENVGVADPDKDRELEALGVATELTVLEVEATPCTGGC